MTVFLLGGLRTDQRPGIVATLENKFDDVEVLDRVGRVTVVVRAPPERKADLCDINNVIWIEEDAGAVEALAAFDADVGQGR